MQSFSQNTVFFVERMFTNAAVMCERLSFPQPPDKLQSKVSNLLKLGFLGYCMPKSFNIHSEFQTLLGHCTINGNSKTSVYLIACHYCESLWQLRVLLFISLC